MTPTNSSMQGGAPMSITTRIHRRVWKRLPGKVGPYVRSGPVSHNWGYDRGTPVDRWYIDRFVAEHRDDIHGRVLEVKSDEYVMRFGHDLEQVDILDVYDTNERATIIADLETADAIPEATFDCIVLTQVIQYCLDVKAAFAQCARILKPGGVLLLTVPGLNKSVPEAELYRFTLSGCERAAEWAFGEGNVEAAACGNSLVAMAFLTGLAAEELDESDLEFVDRRFPVIVTCRAARPVLGA